MNTSSHPAFRLSLMQFNQYFIWGSWYVTVGSYLLNTLGFSGREVGLVYGAPGLAAMISPFAMGVLADRVMPSQKLISILHLLSGVCILVAAQCLSFSWFFGAIIVWAICYQPTSSLSSALCFHHLPDAPNQYPRIRVWGTIGWIAGGTVVGIFGLDETATPLYIAGIGSLIHAIYCLFLPHTPPLGKTSNTRWRPADIFQDKMLVGLMIAMILMSIPASFYYSFVNTFLLEQGVKHTAAKMSIGQVLEIVLMLLMPWVFKNVRWRYVFGVGLLVWGVRYLLFIGGMHWGEWLHLLAILLHGAAYCFSGLAAQIFVNSRVKPEIRSSAQGFYSFVVLGLGTTIGSFIAGEIVGYYTVEGVRNWQSIWMIPALTGIGTAILFYLFVLLFQKTYTQNQ